MSSPLTRDVQTALAAIRALVKAGKILLSVCLAFVCARANLNTYIRAWRDFSLLVRRCVKRVRFETRVNNVKKI